MRLRCEVRCYLRADVHERIRWLPDVDLGFLFGSMDIPGRRWRSGWGAFDFSLSYDPWDESSFSSSVIQILDCHRTRCRDDIGRKRCLAGHRGKLDKGRITVLPPEPARLQGQVVAAFWKPSCNNERRRPFHAPGEKHRSTGHLLPCPLERQSLRQV
jgi:hypothetical protein